MSQKLFVANRGEPIARARQTADRLSFSLAGAVARDELACGWPRLLDHMQVFGSGVGLYQEPERLARCAREMGAQALWPAWGFLAERHEFAQAVQSEGITWVGPPPEVLALFGDKLASREAALAAGLPVLQQVRVEGPADIALVRETFSEYPLLIKGAYGGGGKGQLIVWSADALGEAVDSAQRQNQELFGSPTVLVEPCLEAPRHVEVQVVADSDGRTVILGTRDCSSQRRFQKVIEEAPAPGIELPPEIEKGVRTLLKDAGYVTAGTVEFLVNGGNFCFLEVNPRLQVEHPVTEETTIVNDKRVDLLALMIATARGESLGFEQHEVQTVGHSIEARVYAEDVSRDCLPQTGFLERARWPKGRGIRVESALSGKGEPLLPRYDPMIGKVIATGESREDATLRLDTALGESRLMGLPTNLSLLRGILHHPDFISGRLDTNLLNRVSPLAAASREQLVSAAAVIAYEQIRGGPAVAERPSANASLGALPIRLDSRGEKQRLEVTKDGPDRYHISGVGPIAAFFAEPGSLVLEGLEAGSGYYDYLVSDDQITIYHAGRELQVGWEVDGTGMVSDPHVPPTGGILCQRLVEAGKNVPAGTPLYILESMKMETTVTARWAGRVTEWLVAEGALVERGQSLLTLKVETTAGEGEVSPTEEEERAIVAPNAGALAMAVLGYDLTLKQARQMVERESDEDGSALSAVRHILLLEEVRSYQIEASLALLVRSRGAAQADTRTEQLLDELAIAYGAADRHEFCNREDLLGRFFHANRTISSRREILFLLLASTKGWGDELGAAVANWCPQLPSPREAALKDRVLRLISERAPSHYYALRKPPVAQEYWQDWLATLAPHATLPPAMGEEFNLHDLPRREWILSRWFKEFECRALFCRTIPEGRLYFVEAQREKEPTRLIALAQISPFLADAPARQLPELERAAIACYKIVRRLETKGYQPNHVFLSADDESLIPWGSDADAVERCAEVAARIGGYAAGLRIDATESFLNLGQGTKLLVVRHAPDVGIVSSPPFPMSERRCEDDPEKWLDSRQQRMGKLTNQSRMQLLFDNAEYESVLLPEPKGHRLDVYEGLVSGRPTVVYANDFRRLGGALGAAEGRRLTLAVLYAYFTGKTAIALHDGAGANVKESVVSLVWAGAYFGAVAITSGRATQEDFDRWWKDHSLHAEMAADLAGAGVTSFAAQPPLRHLHLHVGAAVGMLVYGPAIAGLSVMVDHPNVYRVLTGSRTVAVTLGEKLSNYELGGAPVHARCSGDIDLTVSSEPRIYDLAQSLVKVLAADPERPPIESIHSSWQCPPGATILFPNQALREVLDDGFFLELRRELESSGSVTTVLTRLAGTPVVVAALATPVPLTTRNDWRKLYHAARTAADWHLPLVLAFAGRPIPVSLEDEALAEKREFLRVVRDMPTPVLALACGEEALASPLLDDVDFAVLLDRPGNDASGAACQRRVERFDEAFQELAKLLRQLTTIDQPGPFQQSTDKAELPDRMGVTYDMRGFLECTLDEGSFTEFWPIPRLSLICGVATVGGQSVAVIADDPEVLGGAQTRDSLARFTLFNRLAERWQMPLVEFNDSPAFMPGSQQERAAIQGAGGKSLLEEVLTTVPRLAVTLRQSYGGRLVHANLCSLGPPRQGLALHNARLGVMGAAGAATVLYKGDGSDVEEWKANYEKSYLSTAQAEDAGAVDGLCGLDELREQLLNWRGSLE
jgi:acetyl/propionyl-CoA carboxylase alpha subunit/acetyl-CoA carboxylase carboxyltransferase component